MNNAKALIISCDEHTCRLLNSLLAQWRINAESTCDPAVAIHSAKPTFYKIILFEHSDPNSAIELGLDLRTCYPEALIVYISDQPPETGIAEVLEIHSVDILNKPICRDLLFRTIKQFLGSQRLALPSRLQSLEETQHFLLGQVVNLARLLRRFNASGAELFSSDDDVKESMLRDQTVYQTLKKIINATIDDLKNATKPQQYELHMRTLLHCIDNMSFTCLHNDPRRQLLSPGEMRVLSLIKMSMTTQEIADLVHVTEDTVKTHRRNIRRKLALTGKAVDLQSYLKSLEEEAARGDEDENALTLVMGLSGA
jgi:DNA-binding CsgD family transcriptional regulator